MSLLRQCVLLVLFTASLFSLNGCANSIQSIQSIQNYVQLDWGKKNYVKGDKPAAARLYEKASHNGSAEAQYLLGKMLIYGDGVAKDSPGGITWLERSSTMNYAPAMVALGTHYYIGTDGVTQDAGKAASLLEGAARQGELTAMLMLGMVYTLNVGVDCDPQKAAYWLKQASEKGVPIPAQWMDSGYLAKLYPIKMERFDSEKLLSARTRKVQSSLKDFGYDPGPVDGKQGRRTEQAIKDFQQARGMAVNGNIDSALMWHLMADNRTKNN